MKYDRDYFVEKGRKGGKKTLELKGINHFKKISKKGVRSKQKKLTKKEFYSKLYGKTKH